MAIKIDDKEYEDMVAEDRHKELKSALGKISTSLSQKNNTEIVSALEKQTAAINGFGEAIKLLPAPKVNVQQPNVNVDLSSLKEIADKILDGQNKIMEELKILNKPKKWEFEFKRSYDLIQSPITAKQVSNDK